MCHRGQVLSSEPTKARQVPLRLPDLAGSQVSKFGRGSREGGRKGGEATGPLSERLNSGRRENEMPPVSPHGSPACIFDFAWSILVLLLAESCVGHWRPIFDSWRIIAHILLSIVSSIRARRLKTKKSSRSLCPTPYSEFLWDSVCTPARDSQTAPVVHFPMRLFYASSSAQQALKSEAQEVPV